MYGQNGFGGAEGGGDGGGEGGGDGGRGECGGESRGGEGVFRNENVSILVEEDI